MRTYDQAPNISAVQPALGKSVPKSIGDISGDIAGNISWSSFGSLSSAFAPSPESAVTRIIGKAREYESRKAAGSAAERARARAIVAAYKRTAALLEELEVLRLQTLGEATNSSSIR